MKTFTLKITEDFVKKLNLITDGFIWQEVDLLTIRIGKYFIRISKKLTNKTTKH